MLLIVLLALLAGTAAIGLVAVVFGPVRTITGKAGLDMRGIHIAAGGLLLAGHLHMRAGHGGIHVCPLFIDARHIVGEGRNALPAAAAIGCIGIVLGTV